MVYLPSEVIENIISFLGGEKYNIYPEYESTLVRISRQKDQRLKEMMINEVAVLLAEDTQSFICEQHEENYQNFLGARQAQRTVNFQTKYLDFFVIHKKVKYTFNLVFSPSMFNPIFQFKTYLFIEPRVLSTTNKTLCNLNVEAKNTFIWSKDFLEQLTFVFSDELTEILKIED
jgi:hypothetical protein